MQQMDQYIIWILVYLNYIDFVLNFILHTYDAQKLICNLFEFTKDVKKVQWSTLTLSCC